MAPSFAPDIYNIYKQYNRTSRAFKQNYTIYFFVIFFAISLSCYYVFMNKIIYISKYNPLVVRVLALRVPFLSCLLCTGTTL